MHLHDGFDMLDFDIFGERKSFMIWKRLVFASFPLSKNFQR